MAFVLQSGTAPELLYPGLAGIFGMEYKEFDSMIPKVFSVEKSTKAYERVQSFSTLRPAALKEQGAQISFDRIYQGYTANFTNYTYANGVAVTREMYEDDQYNVINKMPKLLAQSMRQAKEILAANVFNSSLTNTGPDGVSLLNASHPIEATGGTFSNLLATPSDLSETTLEQLLILTYQLVDTAGNPVNIDAKAVVVAETLKPLLTKILETQYAVGSGDNDINFVARQNLQMVVSKFITDEDATYLVTNAMNGLTFFERRAIEVQTYTDDATQNIHMVASERYAPGYSDPRGVVGTQGAA